MRHYSRGLELWYGVTSHTTVLVIDFFLLKYSCGFFFHVNIIVYNGLEHRLSDNRNHIEFIHMFTI